LQRVAAMSTAGAAAPASPPQKFLVGLIGEGIQGSRSPALHEHEARHLGLALHYQLIDLARDGRSASDLPRLLDSAQAVGFAGVNITHPCKQAVLPLLDRLSADAEAIGAVNTVVFRDGKRVGHNTDWSGFATPFRRALGDVALGHVSLLGAGGAGAAVAHAILTLGARQLSLVDPDAAKAETLAASLRARFGGRSVHHARDVRAAIAASDGVINATPIGMTGHPGTPVDPSWIEPRQWIAEIVYFPLETEWLRAARKRGCRNLDGGGMAVWQAVGAFELFTGHAPDARRMEQHFRSIVS
jgi:shikimate dehydrogenase